MMTIQTAAQQAIDVQNACNLSGVLSSLHTIVSEVLWPEARAAGFGTRWINQHPIVTMFLYKLSALNGLDRTLEPEYGTAEAACKALTVQ